MENEDDLHVTADIIINHMFQQKSNKFADVLETDSKDNQNEQY